MAKWDARLRKRLKIDLELLEEGIYLETAEFDQLACWLLKKGFEEPKGDHFRGNGFLSPDEKWFVHFRQRLNGYVFVQLRGFFRVRVGL